MKSHKVYRLKLNGYLAEQLELLSERSKKSVEELVTLFVVEGCNAPNAGERKTRLKTGIFCANEVQCTRAGKRNGRT